MFFYSGEGDKTVLFMLEKEKGVGNMADAEDGVEHLEGFITSIFKARPNRAFMNI